jgi:hypothetical protein
MGDTGGGLEGTFMTTSMFLQNNDNQLNNNNRTEENSNYRHTPGNEGRNNKITIIGTRRA